MIDASVFSSIICNYSSVFLHFKGSFGGTTGFFALNWYFRVSFLQFLLLIFNRFLLQVSKNKQFCFIDSSSTQTSAGGGGA